MEEKYFIKKGDESGKLYKLFIPQFSDKNKKTYTSVGGGFDFTFFTDEEIEPAPTHLVVAARLKGDLDPVIWFDENAARMAWQAKMFQQEQELAAFQFQQQLQYEQFKINKGFLSTIGLTQEQVNNQISQIQKGIV